MFAVALVQDNDLISMAFSLTGIKIYMDFPGILSFQDDFFHLLSSAICLCREVGGLK